jgi:hypothetical protein
MKQGKSINDLVREVKRQSDSKIDYTANTRALDADVNGVVCLTLKGRDGQSDRFPLNKIALRQVGDRTGIPAKYVDRMVKDSPDLFATNVNHWFTNEPKDQMVRTVEDKNGQRYVRAFLSNRYRPLDNFDMLDAVLPYINKENITIESCDVTESKMYIKAVDNNVSFELPRDPNIKRTDYAWGRGHHAIDVVRPAITLGNSEVGLSSVFCIPGIWTQECTNLATFRSNAIRKYHVGRDTRGGEEYDHYGIYSEKSNRLSDATVWSKMADLVDASLGGKVFDIIVEKLRASREREITGSVEKAMDCFAEKFKVNVEERSGILTHLIKGGNLSAYGLHSAVTRYSHDVPDYDRASELEQTGADVIELPKQDWQAIALAA